MSLINDVLKDLERREADHPSPEAGQPPATGKGTRRRWNWAGWALMAVAAGALLHFSLDTGKMRPPPASADVLTAGSMVSEADNQPTQGVQNAGPDQPALASQAAAVPETNATESKPTTSDELPAPRETSADTRPAALSEPSEATRELPQRAATADTAPVAPEPPRQEVVRNDDSRSESSEPRISIERAAPVEPEEEALNAAKRLLAQGQLARAESRLRQRIEQAPEDTEAHELLARVLFRRGRDAQAIDALERGLRVAAAPAVLAEPLGRVLIERQAPNRARDVLAEHAPAMNENTDYHLLLAASHRQAGDHASAAAHYRRLSEHLPDSATVWVGLGASLEALEQPEQALAAYRNATGGDDARAAAFARQRIRALGTTTGTAP